MFSKILYPTDFSDVAARALNYVKQLREAGSQEVVILHVINQRIVDGMARHGIRDSDIELWDRKDRETADTHMTTIRTELEAVGFTVTCRVETGFPWNVILDVEKEVKPSAIVIGSHGRSNLGDIFLGSVSDRVIRKCRCPVLVVKRDLEN
jgi:nucleotide-binding universal stress UspA family protein